MYKIKHVSQGVFFEKFGRISIILLTLLFLGVFFLQTIERVSAAMSVGLSVLSTALPPAPTFTLTLANSYTAQYSGITIPNGVVYIQITGDSYFFEASVSADSLGNWSYTGPAMNQGQYTTLAYVKDEFDQQSLNSSAQEFNTTIPAPIFEVVVNSGSTATLNGTSGFVSGVAHVEVDSVPAYTTDISVSASGTWTYTTGILASGWYTATVFYKDGLGSSGPTTENAFLLPEEDDDDDDDTNKKKSSHGSPSVFFAGTEIDVFGSPDTVLDETPFSGDMKTEEDLSKQEKGDREDRQKKEGILFAGGQKTFLHNLVTNPLAKKTFQSLGVFSGVSVALLSTLLPVLQNTPQVFQGSVASMFGGIGNKRKRRKWGIVFDSQTKHPVPGVIVSLIDETQKRIVETQITDAEGRYGFLPKSGAYTLDIRKGEYSIDISSAFEPTCYGVLYTGKPFSVNSNDEIINVNIALDSKGFDWRQFAERQIKQHNSLMFVFFRNAISVIFWGGFAYSIIVLFFVSNTLNVLVVSLYFLLALLMWFAKESFGTLNERNTGKPVPFAQIELYEAGDARRIKFAITDTMGRYYMLTKPGRYTLIVKGSKLSGETFEKKLETNLKEGILRERMEV